MDTLDLIIIIGGIALIIYVAGHYSKKDGKWNDSAVTKDRVIEALKMYKLTDEKFQHFNEKGVAEVNWNKDLEKYLATIFLHVKRGNLSKAVEIDLDIGRGKVGLELKWAGKINSKNPKNNTIGQIRDYKKDGNYKNLILVVAGTSEEKHHPYLTEIEETIKDDFDCDYFFMEIKS